ncbi:MAG: polyprenyl synthetase family protein [Bacteroidaceae bacterium]|nr:polyprenyl synthetase family protein [Bacteroidaceae bacterium]
MYSSKQLLQMVEEAIASLPLEREPQGLYAPIRYVLSLGGKRIRPVLMLMAYNLYHDDVRPCLMPAIGIETFHNFTLLHDDFMDHAEVRRGKTCVHLKWNDNTAILSGDNMLVLAFQYMMQCDEAKMPAIMRLFTKTATEIDEGQQYDIDFETRNDVTEAEYIEMIRLKTSVLLACALQIGATLGGASEQDAQSLYRYGECLGLAFQLQDDYLDVYGDPKVFGKKIGGDILCDKKTFMLINALLHASDEDRAELERWIGNKDCNPDEKIQAVTTLYTKIGVHRMAQERMDAYYAEAEACLNEVSLPEERKQMLRGIALELMGRQS